MQKIDLDSYEQRYLKQRIRRKRRIDGRKKNKENESESENLKSNEWKIEKEFEIFLSPRVLSKLVKVVL